MNGVVNVLKPPGMTSHDVVAILRKITKIKRIGHTGTLDPMATGVLPICIGKSTKIVEYLTDSGKEYIAELTLGYSTDTLDRWGKITGEDQLEQYDLQKVLSHLNEFIGEIEQTPPMFSALKVDGQKLVDLARMGKTVDIKKRKITVYEIEVLRSEGKQILLRIACSKGTYIRTLLYDLAKKAGYEGHMSYLVRSKSGGLDIHHALTIESLYNHVEMIQMREALQFPEIIIDQDDEKKLNFGIKLELQHYPHEISEKYKVINSNGRLIAIAGYQLETNKILIEKFIDLG